MHHAPNMPKMRHSAFLRLWEAGQVDQPWASLVALARMFVGLRLYLPSHDISSFPTCIKYEHIYD